MSAAAPAPFERRLTEAPDEGLLLVEAEGAELHIVIEHQYECAS